MSIFLPKRFGIAASACLLLNAGVHLFAEQPPNPSAPQGQVEASKGTQKPVANTQLRPNRPRNFLPGLNKRAVTVYVSARILSADDEELWKTESEEVTIPGRPILLKLVGANVAMVVQFTAYFKREAEWTLLAQGQIWLENNIDNILHYETTLQTIPVKLGEPVYYFPLGSSRPDGGDYIEIRLQINPYSGASMPEDRKEYKKSEQEKSP